MSKPKERIQGTKRMAKTGDIREVKTGDIREVEGSANSIEIDNLARFAVDDHNKKQNSVLEFKRVVNVKQQVVAGTMYYITLEVNDAGHTKVYEAKVWEKPWLNFKEVQEFKLIGDAPSGSST